MDISTGEGAEKSGDRGGTEASVMVGDKASGRKRSERKESSVNSARDRWRGDRKEPKVRGGGFSPSEEGVGGVGGVKYGDRGGSEESAPIGAQEGGDPNEGMGQGRVGKEIARDRRGLERERELPGDVGGAPNRQCRSIRQCERHRGEFFRGEKGA